jgi:uncharacterized membrane protein
MNVRKISWQALFVALSVIGGMIKVPAPISSVALDSFPALVAAVLLGPAAGALTGAFGHLVSALMGGFPMGPLHIIVAIEMAAVIWLFGKLYTAGNKWSASLFFILLNGLVSPAPFILFLGIPFYISAVPAITIAAAFNGIAAYVLIPRIAPVFAKRYGRLHA